MHLITIFALGLKHFPHIIYQSSIDSKIILFIAPAGNNFPRREWWAKERVRLILDALEGTIMSVGLRPMPGAVRTMVGHWSSASVFTTGINLVHPAATKPTLVRDLIQSH